MPSAKGKPTDPKLKEKVTAEIKAKPNNDGSGKGQMAAWKANQIGKEYEAHGGDYENEPGSKNKPKKGPPEKKSEATKAKETKKKDYGPASDNSDEFYRNANREHTWNGSKYDPNATETDSETSEYAMKREDKPKTDKTDKTEKIGAKKGVGRAKKGTARPVKKNARGDKEKEKKDTGKGKGRKEQKKQTSPKMGQRSSSRQAEAVSAQIAGEKRKSSGGDDKGSAKKAKK